MQIVYSQSLKAMHIKQTHMSNTQPFLLKKHVSPAHRLPGEIKHENTTKCIVHSGLVVNLSSVAIIEHRQICRFDYLKRWQIWLIA